MNFLTFALISISAHAFDCGKFKKPNDKELHKKLSAEQYKITQEAGTEPPFRNAYYNQHDDGIFVDVVSGEPLFSSADKYDSGTGWPSFTKPIEASALISKTDPDGQRKEVESHCAKSHLGHVFDDGPKESTGLRYCMNSAALRFIPKAELKKQGYGEYLKLFEKGK